MKAVLLDFYGTLAVVVPGSQRPFGELMAERGYEVDAWVGASNGRSDAPTS